MKPRNSNVMMLKGVGRMVFGKTSQFVFHLRNRGSRWLDNGSGGANALPMLRKVMLVLTVSLHWTVSRQSRLFKLALYIPFLILVMYHVLSRYVCILNTRLVPSQHKECSCLVNRNLTPPLRVKALARKLCLSCPIPHHDHLIKKKVKHIHRHLSAN